MRKSLGRVGCVRTGKGKSVAIDEGWEDGTIGSDELTLAFVASTDDSIRASPSGL